MKDMMEPIPFKGWITFEDALRVEHLLVPRKIWSVSGVTTILVTATIAIKVMDIDTSWPFTVLFLVITAAFIGGLFWVMQRSNMKAKRKHYDKDSIERSGNVSADKITIVTDKTRTEMQWDLFDKVIEADDLVLVAKDKEYMAFAPYMFSTRQDWMTCREIVKKLQDETPTIGDTERR